MNKVVLTKYEYKEGVWSEVDSIETPNTGCEGDRMLKLAGVSDADLRLKIATCINKENRVLFPSAGFLYELQYNGAYPFKF